MTDLLKNHCVGFPVGRRSLCGRGLGMATALRQGVVWLALSIPALNSCSTTSEPPAIDYRKPTAGQMLAPCVRGEASCRTIAPEIECPALLELLEYYQASILPVCPE